MGRGSARTNNGDMRQRGQVVHREAMAIKIRSKLAIRHTSANGHCARLRVKFHSVELLQRYLIVAAVGDPIEGVPSTQRLQLAAALHHLLDLLRVLRKVQVVGMVLVVAGPVGSMLVLLLTSCQSRS